MNGGTTCFEFQAVTFRVVEISIEFVIEVGLLASLRWQLVASYDTSMGGSVHSRFIYFGEVDQSFSCGVVEVYKLFML